MAVARVYVTGLGIASFIAIVGAYIYHKKKKQIIPTTWEEIGKIKSLNLYPLKSGHRVELQKAECTDVGLRQTEDDGKVFQMRDRSFIVYGEKDKEFRTARTYPKLVLIDVAVYDEDHLAVDAPTMRTLYVKIPSKDDKNQISVKVHRGEVVHGIDCGEEAALWLSRYILEKDSGLRLGYHDASTKRNIAHGHKDLLDYYKNLTSNSMGLYSDVTSVHLVNQSSVNDLVKRIGNSTVTVDNFRPNIVVEGPNLEPYCEDEWDWIKIGDVVLRNVKDCTRCILTTVDPVTGTMGKDREPLKTLETYRISQGPKALPMMGINIEVKICGIINVGDVVLVSKNKT